MKEKLCEMAMVGDLEPLTVRSAGQQLSAPYVCVCVGWW